MTNSLVDRWNRGCDSRPLLQEADQTITQLHAAVKTAQELAARRLMEIEQLRAQLQQVVAIGFEAGVEAQKCSHEPLPGAFDAAATDALTSVRGTGFVKFMADGSAQHVPHADVYEPLLCDCPEVCKVCGGRAQTCSVLGHRSDTDRSVKWHECAQGASRDASSEKSGVFAEILSHHPDCSFHSTVAPATPVCDCGVGNPPPCECLVRDKEPSAYHNVKCPRYVADKL